MRRQSQDVGKILFGPAGIPHSAAAGTDTVGGIELVSQLGLTAMEVEFVRGVRINQVQAERAKRVSMEKNISLSVHAPYFINCSPIDNAKIPTTKRNIIASVKAAHEIGARIVVIHPGFYMGRPALDCVRQAQGVLREVIDEINSFGVTDVWLGLETMGKRSQLGSLDEVCELSGSLERTQPVLDFGHMHARENGCIKSKRDYERIFSNVEKTLGAKAMAQLHCHVSEIEYSPAGERFHLPLDTRDSPPWRPMLELVHENGYSGTLICESPLLEKDALKMQKYFGKLEPEKK